MRGATGANILLICSGSRPFRVRLCWRVAQTIHLGITLAFRSSNVPDRRGIWRHCVTCWKEGTSPSTCWPANRFGPVHGASAGFTNIGAHSNPRESDVRAIVRHKPPSILSKDMTKFYPVTEDRNSFPRASHVSRTWKSCSIHATAARTPLVAHASE